MFHERVKDATFFETRALIFYSFILNVVVFYYVELECSKFLLKLRHETILRTRRFRKRTWDAFMIVNISELEIENCELWTLHGNLYITMAYLNRFS